MHNSTFSVAQYGTLSLPPTTGVKADYMGKEVIVKTQATKCDSLWGEKKKSQFRTKLHKSINAYIFSMRAFVMTAIKTLGVLITRHTIWGVLTNKRAA